MHNNDISCLELFSNETIDCTLPHLRAKLLKLIDKDNIFYLLENLFKYDNEMVNTDTWQYQLFDDVVFRCSLFVYFSFLRETFATDVGCMKYLAYISHCLQSEDTNLIHHTLAYLKRECILLVHAPVLVEHVLFKRFFLSMMNCALRTERNAHQNLAGVSIREETVSIIGFFLISSADARCVEILAPTFEKLYKFTLSDAEMELAIRLLLYASAELSPSLERYLDIDKLASLVTNTNMSVYCQEACSDIVRHSQEFGTQFILNTNPAREIFIGLTVYMGQKGRSSLRQSAISAILPLLHTFSFSYETNDHFARALDHIEELIPLTFELAYSEASGTDGSEQKSEIIELFSLLELIIDIKYISKVRIDEIENLHLLVTKAAEIPQFKVAVFLLADRIIRWEGDNANGAISRFAIELAFKHLLSEDLTNDSKLSQTEESMLDFIHTCIMNSVHARQLILDQKLLRDVLEKTMPISGLRRASYHILGTVCRMGLLDRILKPGETVFDITQSILVDVCTQFEKDQTITTDSNNMLWLLAVLLRTVEHQMTPDERQKLTLSVNIKSISALMQRLFAEFADDHVVFTTIIALYIEFYILDPQTCSYRSLISYWDTIFLTLANYDEGYVDEVYRILDGIILMLQALVHDRARMSYSFRSLLDGVMETHFEKFEESAIDIQVLLSRYEHVKQRLMVQ
jgi:hypothetical protein